MSSTSQPAKTIELTESERYRMLANEHRRLTLELLLDNQAPIGLKELAKAVVAKYDEGEGPGQEDVNRVMVALHHKHLPMMAELGTIRYDPSANCIEAVNVTPDLLVQ